ncbi:DUF3667 domain-containing protein [Xanthomarina spongicola]|uniref:Uncharacterized protein DUF3667 n=1 Tax=Xanthomarina spongicola TaxID=570520 RepID=A0A316DQJ6_9FLAO|nr:DUF3667 domain-containing protein [Xanthomarina spongicola]PWK19013.1 uncharacterized protein DUF3667 [Xanthomarina spongicola]
MNNESCKNCSVQLVGKFCHNCGEKVVEKTDFSLKTLLHQFVDGVFNIDSKVYKTFIHLLFKPGILTIRYIEGIRKPFMKPIQVFLIANVLFFLLLTQADILRIPAKYYFNSGKNLNIEKKMVATGSTETELVQSYDRVSTNISKSAVVLIVPVLAIAFWVLFYQTRFLFGMHLIFAMHYLSFFFLSCLLAISVHKFGNRAVQAFIILTNFIYLFFAIKEVYKSRYIIAFLKTIAILLIFVVITGLYREFISYLSFKIL